MKSQPSTILESTPELLKHLLKKAWLPETKETEGALEKSKFGGKPYLLPTETYPCCKNCGKPLPLFLQLNLNELPTELNEKFGNGLLQFFYCTSSEPHCEYICKGYNHFAECSLLRIISPDQDGLVYELPESEDFFPEKIIKSWNEILDFPNYEELYKIKNEFQLVFSEMEKHFIEEHELTAKHGDKLAGYPAWVQGVEYPNCPICNKQMHVVFQIDSEENVPYMFGDTGNGHITQCPDHKNQLAFGWACY